jgi:hypothetical protein
MRFLKDLSRCRWAGRCAPEDRGGCMQLPPCPTSRSIPFSKPPIAWCSNTTCHFPQLGPEHQRVSESHIQGPCLHATSVVSKPACSAMKILEHEEVMVKNSADLPQDMEEAWSYCSPSQSRTEVHGRSRATSCGLRTAEGPLYSTYIRMRRAYHPLLQPTCS